MACPTRGPVLNVGALSGGQRQSLSPGQTVAMTAEPSNIHLFDSETGERLS